MGRQHAPGPGVLGLLAGASLAAPSGLSPGPASAVRSDGGVGTTSRTRRLRRGGLATLAVTAGVLQAGGCDARVPAELVLRDDGACGDCVELTPGPVIGTPEDPLPHVHPFLAGGGSGRFFLTNVTQGFEAVGVFDSAGRFERTLGSGGEGPGEFREPWIPFVDRGDTLFVLDLPAQRMNVFDPELRYLRRFQTPGYPFRILDRFADGTFLALMQNHRDGQVALPLHRISWEGEAVCSFGDERTEEPDPQVLPLANERNARVDPEGGVWVVSPFRYEIELWESCAPRPSRILRREVDWFRERTAEQALIELRERAEPPGARVVGLRRDDEGRLWVLVRIPSEVWSADTALDAARASEAYDTLVEVIDPQSGRVLASQRTATALSFADDGTLHAYVPHPLDFVFTQIWSIRLVDR